MLCFSSMTVAQAAVSPPTCEVMDRAQCGSGLCQQRVCPYSRRVPAETRPAPRRSSTYKLGHAPALHRGACRRAPALLSGMAEVFGDSQPQQQGFRKILPATIAHRSLHQLCLCGCEGVSGCFWKGCCVPQLTWGRDQCGQSSAALAPSRPPVVRRPCCERQARPPIHP